MGFYPPSNNPEEARRIDTEINIRLPTPGSVFLVFQALYPYLLHSASADQIRVSIIGGTNVSSSPSYDYVSQVLIPNFARVGLPPITVQLEKRGWASGKVQMGKVIFAIDPLRRGTKSNGGTPSCDFPAIDLHQFRRGKISKIDITILAPDDQLGKSDQGSGRTKRNQKLESSQQGKSETVRAFMERRVYKTLRKQLKKLPASVFSEGLKEELDAEGSDIVPIETHTTEVTHRRSYMYVLIVAHTSTGFKIGRDALYGALRDEPKPKKRRNNPSGDMASGVEDLVDECVENFIRELYDPQLQAQTGSIGIAPHRPCVDEYMRDQLVVFEALGGASDDGNRRHGESREDERHWSLHTKTAQWVCREMLGDNCFG
jgi:RNA 3'-terminal phosphate cyclase (ATP)